MFKRPHHQLKLLRSAVLKAEQAYGGAITRRQSECPQTQPK